MNPVQSIRCPRPKMRPTAVPGIAVSDGWVTIFVTFPPGLENRYTRKGIESSNLSLSAFSFSVLLWSWGVCRSARSDSAAVVELVLELLVHFQGR